MSEPADATLTKKIHFVSGRQIYDLVIQEMIPRAEDFVWIATADIKDLYIHEGRKMVPFLAVLSDLIERGVSIRLLHAKEPGPRFREDFDRFPNLFGGMERMLCPRVHFKSVIADGTFAYSGSANLTGAGMGAKSDNRRNFEAGIITSEPALVGQIMNQFDAIWMGERCGPCDRKEYCSEHFDM